MASMSGQGTRFQLLAAPYEIRCLDLIKGRIWLCLLSEHTLPVPLHRRRKSHGLPLGPQAPFPTLPYEGLCVCVRW